MLVEENNGNAILRSATEFQPAGALRMPIPYQYGCAYTFAKGKFLHLKSWLLGRWVSGAHIVALTQARDVTWHLGAHYGYPILCFIEELYVTGGIINDTVTNRAEVIDLANRTGTQTAIPPMQVTRNWHASAAAGPLVFVFGGLNERVERTSSCEFYDSRTNR